MSTEFAYVGLSRWDFGGFRLLGPGLGNLLFPWARAISDAGREGLPVIWPTWPQIKIGPVVRRELDSRSYVGLFRNPGEYVDGATKYLLLGIGQRVDEGATHMVPARGQLRPRLRVFRGTSGLFAPIIGQQNEVLRELLRITRPEHVKGTLHDFTESITVHVRLGDFIPASDQLLRAGRPNVRLPIAWIRETIAALRCELGDDWPVWVFSDGRDDDLSGLLSVRGVHRLHFGSALADMLAMAQSNVLVVASTYSMWSSYLGSVPSVYYPGQRRQVLHPDKAYWEIELESGREPWRAFIQNVAKRANPERALH